MPQMVAPQPQPVPQLQDPVSFDRYGVGDPQPDPLKNLEVIPDLEPLADVAQPENMGDKANYAFASLKSKVHAERKRAEEFLQKYNALVESTKGFVDEKAAFADALNAKDRELKQIQDDLGKIELSRSPVFKQKYDSPLEDICAAMAEVLRNDGVEDEQSYNMAYDIMTADPADVPGMIADRPALAQGELVIHARNAQKILEDRQAELDDWRNSQAGFDAVAQRQNSIQFAQHMDEMAGKAVQILHSLAPEQGQVPAYAVVDPDFSRAREEKEAQFKQWLSRAPEDQRYAAMLEGFMAPLTYQMLQQTTVENMQLKQALSSRAGLMMPRSVPVAPPAPTPRPVEPPRPADPYVGASVGANDAQTFAGEFLRQMMS